MKYELKNYQQKAVDSLLKLTKAFLDIGGEQEIVFKAPTGSGKTIMMAGYLEQLKNLELGDFAFVWVSVNKLHNQSKKSLENTIGIGAFNFYNLENVRDKLNKNDVLFINWESITKKAKSENLDKGIKKGDYTNIFMGDNENNRNLPNFIENTLDEGRKIILIIDESHLYLSEDTEKLIKNILKPTIRIEVSATPRRKENVSVELKEVIDSGMIKKEVVINEGFGYINLLETTGEDLILKEGIEKREKLKELYNKLYSLDKLRCPKDGGVINYLNPLLLIQIPGDREKTSPLEKTEIEKIEKTLKEKYGISRENNRLAVWLSEDKFNLENIEKFDSPVEVLIFKQAIATGWDCPRAQVLVMFREIKSITFEIQTVGRIMRMPELMHYENEELNKAYVYTNFGEINISSGEASEYLKVKQSSINPKFENIVLKNSVYLKRLDYNDLSPAEQFHQVFYKAFLDEIGGKENDLVSSLYDKLNDKVNLNKEYKTTILLETKLIGLDEVYDVSTGQTKTDEKIIEYTFKKILDSYLTGLNKARSSGILKQSFYNFFNHYLGFKNKTSIEIQRIVITNKEFFEYIVHNSIKNFEEIRLQNIEQKQEKSIDDWSIPIIEMYKNDYLKRDDFIKSVYLPCYFKEDSKLEKEFVEEYLEKTNEIEYWYKNGVSSKIYFGIEYLDSGKSRVFYPDFIVKYKNGKVGVFDTKDGNTASSMETKFKAEALQNYCKEYKNIFGGIVIKNGNNFYINSNETYNFVNDNLAGWERI